ncbi:MAG: hypothetical protein IJS96_00395 [Schwartzia sp.]|nr:hypothetical protein [Schwartzia sp. (in: firmicutes)]
MQKKDTENLFAELEQDAKIERFLSENREEFLRPLPEYLEQLLAEKHLEKHTVIRESHLDRSYAYQIFSGRKENPSRPKLLALALAMRLNLDETQYLLRYAGHGSLYPRNPWDSIIISAIGQGLSVMETNLLLEKLGETVLLQ